MRCSERCSVPGLPDDAKIYKVSTLFDLTIVRETYLLIDDSFVCSAESRHPVLLHWLAVFYIFLRGGKVFPPSRPLQIDLAAAGVC